MKRNLRNILMLIGVLLALLSVPVLAADSGLDFTLTTNGTIHCGTQTNLTILPQSGSSTDYWYHLNAVYLKEDGVYNLVIDPSSWASPYSAYQKDSNQIPFTFYASGDYLIDVSMMTSTAPHQVKTKKIALSIHDPEYPSIEAIADRVAGECKSVCTTEFDQALWLHDWLVEHCKYDYAQVMYCNAEGALARGTGTCEAYHRAYCMLLKRVGIETGRMEGNGHVWTAAKLDGKWCQIDVTWDDNGWSAPGAEEQYLYFGLNDTLMKLAHSDHTTVDGYRSDTLENNYFIRTGKIKTWSEPFVPQIQAKLNDEVFSFTLPVFDTDPESTAAIKYALAAYDLTQETWKSGSAKYTLAVSYLQNEFSCTATPTGSPSEGTLSALNTTEHIAYVMGDSDGMIRPNASLTRAQTATMLYRLLTEQRREEIFTAQNDFQDVHHTLWYNKAVSSMSHGGYLNGYSDGTFRGNNSITRAEFVTMLARFVETSGTDASFTDVPSSHWAYSAIAIAAQQGWVSGYQNGTFQPDKNITRAEAMTILNRMLQRGVDENSSLGQVKTWPDNLSSAWYYYEIVEATNGHIPIGQRPSERWSNETLQLFYDVDKYEKP